MGPKTNDRDLTHYISDLKLYASQSLSNLIISNNEGPNPFTFVIYTLLFNWAADVATAFQIPSALLFVQPATLLALYYYYFHGYGDTISNQAQLQENIVLPGSPLSFTCRDMPSFFFPSSSHASFVPLFKEQLELLLRRQNQNQSLLVNTFDALEIQALRAIGELKMVPIGPLIPSNLVHGGLSKIFPSEDYIEWLNSKAESSVVYVSFGSICELSNEQEEEILNALMRPSNNDDEEKYLKKVVDLEVEGRGKIVCWCCQTEVLKHGSLGCFMTRCGWNSSIESLSFGLPVVAFPQQIDQATNAKLVEDLWKTGVRVKAANEEGFVEKQEIRQCLELVMESKDNNGKREEIERNVKKWKELAREAIIEGGSSSLNLETFVADIDGGCFP